ncbi:MAG: hypothetical protein R2751_18650 [Bacteroidales bacterium]
MKSLSFFAGLLCMLGTGPVLVSCRPAQKLGADPSPAVLYPPPPAEARIQYFSSISSSSDVAPPGNGLRRYLLGREEEVVLRKPYGMDAKGPVLYVADAGLPGLVLIDLDKGQMKPFSPGGEGRMSLPINCVVDDRGRLFVADAGRRKVLVFDAEGRFLAALEGPEPFKPTDVQVHERGIWVASVEGHALHEFDSDDYSWKKQGPVLQPGAPGFLRQATNLAMDSSRIWVSDFGDFNVKQYSLDGEWMGSVGGAGHLPGRFTRPKGIAVDRNGILYVVDAAFQNVQMFNPGGEVLMSFGGSTSGKGAMFLPAGICISYENLDRYSNRVPEGTELKYLIYVCNQYGSDKINVYGYLESVDSNGS